jgi:hypothetical protein
MKATGHPHAWRRQIRIGRKKTAPEEDLTEKDAELILAAIKRCAVNFPGTNAATGPAKRS